MNNLDKVTLTQIGMFENLISIDELERISATDFYEMNPIKKLSVNCSLAFLEFSNPQYSSSDFYSKVSTNETIYKYKFGFVLFESVKDVENYFSMNIHRIWYKNRTGELNGFLEKINEIHVSDKNGNTIDVIKRKV